MIQITERQNCCGCSACASICPKQCIAMRSDSEGFLYPVVDKDICIDCGLCEKVCNELYPFEKQNPITVLAAINKDESVRLKSSSGGIFHILASQIIAEGGVVFGARFDENWQVVIDYAEDLKGVEAFMGSKYVQARIENAYKDAKRFLIDGRKVLFSGTPCQVAGLRQFLRKSYDNLLTVDFVCHGTPSPKVWEMYLDEVAGTHKDVRRIDFRNKKLGWKNFSFSLEYNESDNTISLLSSFHQNPYMKAFLDDIILRPSCYNCKARGGSSKSDITIADFWGIKSIFPNMDDDKGTGMVFINTLKGEASIDLTKITYAETSYERVKPYNPSCYRSPKVHPKRDLFFSRIGNENLISLIHNCTKPTIKKRIYRLIGRCRALTFRLLGGGIRQTRQDIAPKISRQVTLVPENTEIVSIKFRNKGHGWKNYRMEIRLKCESES